MVSSLLTALDLDEKSTLNQLILIEENSTSDGSFVLSTLIERELRAKHKVLILLLHNSMGHYHSIGQKLGYNLLEQEKLGNVVVVDFPKIFADEFRSGECGRSENILKSLSCSIKESVESSGNQNVTLFVEHVSNLLLLGFPLVTTFGLCNFFRGLLYEFSNFSITCLIHKFLSDHDSRLLINYLKHFAKLNISLDDLETGKAKDVSGKMTVKWRTKDLMQWNESHEYHYQLLDKNINVFTPGAKYV